MIELTSLDKTIRLDIRYARSDNFVGRPVYAKARAFLQEDAAQALVRVHKGLRSDGLGLVVFDGYRPWRITKLFWDVVTLEQREFVADPATGSKHNRGCAVDLSMFYLSSGEPVEMPSDFDEFNETASPDYKGGSACGRANRDLLRSRMEAEGFTVNPNEWWHFDHRNWKRHKILDVPFSALAAT